MPSETLSHAGARAFLWASRRGGSRWEDGAGIQQGKDEEGRAGESTAITQRFAVASRGPRGSRKPSVSTRFRCLIS